MTTNMEITKHFTTSVYIVHKNKILLHQHKRYNILLPVGRHIERDELPDETAIKEAKEESGLDISLYNSNSLKEDHFKKATELNRGEHLNLHFVGPQHQHIDFIFYATANSNKLNPQKGETKELYWFTEEEIKNSTVIEEVVKTYALEALEILKD